METSQRVNINGTPIDVRTSGSGPVLLFIHGVYVNSHLWDDVVALIGSNFRCVLPDLPLGGHQTPLGSAFKPDLDELAALIPGVMEELDLHDVTIIGNDTGGGLVLLALQDTAMVAERISRVILTNCDSYDHLPPTAFLPLVRMAKKRPWLARLILRPMLMSRLGRNGFLGSVTATKAARARRDELFGSKAVLNDAVSITAALMPTNDQLAMDWLTNVTVPVQLVWGDSDKFFPITDAERLAKALPSASITVVPGSSTYVALDAPAAVATAITAT
jgi:pimeloyl-ACP methyl ester carboxylesterase